MPDKSGEGLLVVLTGLDQGIIALIDSPALYVFPADFKRGVIGHGVEWFSDLRVKRFCRDPDGYWIFG